MTIDPQYTVGFSWARQYGFRVTKNFSNKVWFGFSVENSQEDAYHSRQHRQLFLLGSPGLSGGLYNGASAVARRQSATTGAPVTTCSALANYSYNPSPDFIGKLAFQPGLRTHRNLRPR